jgi:glycosyltransferase involved in cell wall biosynthesis
MLSLTVVIPLYNKEAYVKNTLVSLADQQQKPREIIVVDDASTDSSLAIVEQTFSELGSAFAATNVKIIKLAENAGPGNARNIGIGESTSDLICFLDADDAYHPDFVETVTHYMLSKQIDFLVVGFQLQPSLALYPKIDKLKAYLSSVTDELYSLPNPLLAVSSPHFFMGRGSNVVVYRKWIGEHRYETGAVLNEGVDFWYRVLKTVHSNSQSNVGLLYGSYIHVTEVQGSLSRRTYSHWKELKEPPTVERFRLSTNPFDQQLSGMLTLRWYRHAMKSMDSAGQKIRFVFHHRMLILRAVRYKLVRGFIKV